MFFTYISYIRSFLTVLTPVFLFYFIIMKTPIFILICIIIQVVAFYAYYQKYCITEDTTDYSERFFIAIACLTILLEFKILTYFTDREAERIIEQLYERHGDYNKENYKYSPFYNWSDIDAKQYELEKEVIAGFGNPKLGKERLKGVIKGAEPIGPLEIRGGYIYSEKQQNTAVILIHGLNQTPSFWNSIINVLKNYRCDVYAPLLAFHGRDLTALSKLDSNIVQQELVSYLAHPRFKQYNQIVFVAHSFGASQLIKALNSSHIAPLYSNIKNVIFYSPAFYANGTTNAVIHNLLNLIPFIYREYTNHFIFGSDSQPLFLSDKIKTFNVVDRSSVLLFYKSGRSLIEVINFDLWNRHYIDKLKNAPFKLTLFLPNNDESILADKCKSEFKKKLQDKVLILNKVHATNYGFDPKILDSNHQAHHVFVQDFVNIITSTSELMPK